MCMCVPAWVRVCHMHAGALRGQRALDRQKLELQAGELNPGPLEEDIDKCVCTPNYVNTTCSVHTMLLICVWFQSWPLDIAFLTGVLFLGEDYCSSSQHSLAAYSAFPGLKSREVSPFVLVCLLVLSLFWSCLDSHVVETSWVSCLWNF